MNVISLVWSLLLLKKRPKLCGNSAFSQNFQTGKLGEITVFYAVQLSDSEV